MVHMKTNSILLQEITVEELQQLLGSTIKSGILELHKELQTKNYNEELLSRDETCQFLKIDSSTLWSWTNKGKVIAHAIGSRRYYKRSELLKSLTLLKK
jgi:hypothetical protein